MCGLCGIFSSDQPVDPSWVQRMNAVLRHRGPDDEGYLVADTTHGRWTPRSGEDTVQPLKSEMERMAGPEPASPNLVFGHRRLSIIDLSEQGHQPMCRQGNWIVYNGEIYNYLELRSELFRSGDRFETESDTEVILAAYDRWGTECLNRLNGMWAFALWDSRRRTLFCARDRFGIKPFYYTVSHDHFVFASEIKAILESGLYRAEANDRAVYEFLTYGLVDQLRETFFKSVYRLMPGEFLTVDERGVMNRTSWWDLGKNAAPENVTERFRHLFQESVRLRLRSDVPVGSCLSGGLDSSYIVSQMAALVDEMHTFSAVYGKGHHGDESEYIDAVVEQSRAVKHTVCPGPGDLLEEIDRLVYHQEEPFGSTSIFAQWQVMTLARKRGVTVLLDGQGADEQLGGYPKYFDILCGNLLKRFQWVRLSHSLFHYLKRQRRVNVISHCLYYALPKRIRTAIITRRLPLNKAFSKKYAACEPGDYPACPDRLAKHFIVRSMPQLLRYEDKNSMAFSIETRLPFLDYRLVEFIFSLPFHLKIHRGVTKKVMREAMRGGVPEKIRNRHDKIGFETPEMDWFRNELNTYIAGILNTESFNRRPYWDPAEARKMYDRVLQGKNRRNHIWRFLSVELWLQRFIDGPEAASV